MEPFESTNIVNLHPLPGYLGDRILACSEQAGHEDLDRQLVALSKRGFIVTNAMATGSDQQIIAKVELFRTAMEAYISLCEERIYTPLQKNRARALSKRETGFVAEFQEMKTRLIDFLQLLPLAAISHRFLCSRAICRMEKMIIQRCAVEREVLYPLLSGKPV